MRYLGHIDPLDFALWNLKSSDTSLPAFWRMALLPPGWELSLIISVASNTLLPTMSQQDCSVQCLAISSSVYTGSPPLPDPSLTEGDDTGTAAPPGGWFLWPGVAAMACCCCCCCCWVCRGGCTSTPSAAAAPSSTLPAGGWCALDDIKGDARELAFLDHLPRDDDSDCFPGFSFETGDDT
jgi:hypothetical protein